MEPTRNNRGVSHENGTNESAHRHLKSRLDQALMIRGSRDFGSVDAYRHFIRKIVSSHNQRIHKEYFEELTCLRALPERKMTDYHKERVVVTNSSTMWLKGVIYSVPSKLIGETLKVHVHDDRLECFVDGDRVVSLQRKYKKKRYERQIDYRHVIGAMVRKPTAFKNYIYKKEFFSALAFKQKWERLNRHYDSNKACKKYVMILKEAALERRDKEKV